MSKHIKPAFSLQGAELAESIVSIAKMPKLFYELSSVNRDQSDETVCSNLIKIL